MVNLSELQSETLSQKSQDSAVEMAQWGKGLPWKLGVAAHIHNPRTPVLKWEAEARRSLKVHGPTRLSQARWKRRTDTQGCLLTPTHTYIYIIHIHIYTYTSYIYIHIHHTYTYIYIIHIHIHTYIYIIYIHIHTYTSYIYIYIHIHHTCTKMEGWKGWTGETREGGEREKKWSPPPESTSQVSFPHHLETM
jgi:hypothetical protein